MSSVNIHRVKELLKSFEFQELFVEELGWERQRGKHNIAVGDDLFEVASIAEKKGLVAFACQPIAGADFPDGASRKRIEKEVAKLHFEHLIVFIDSAKSRQIWQVPKREGGKTKGHSEIPYYAGKGVEHLARRVEQISFTLGETEDVSLLEVAARVNQALLAEKVTKRFFKEFSEKRKGFVKFLEWIEDEAKRDWYCSVLLNRLMFIYFLGGKGFLPGDTEFLTNSLNDNIQENGPDTFYTHFLLPLSFFGLGERQGQRGRFEATFKDVLYLDGGLFAVHQVERELGLDKTAVDKGVFPAGARIPDEQFRKWFAYFDDWRWTLDEDKVENDGYISPHILGYIFEKYINQKQMGAYYTKEDITGYICRNTIIPRLFDMLAETGSKGQQAVQPLPIGPHPNLLNDGRGISDGEGIDRYIYPSVKQDDKLPTETDYEQTQRRNRYEGILADFDGGKIAAIDDFITYNLDIEKLALDFVGNIQDPEVLHAFYFKGLQRITVLDPTCGSGAFLFAALNILYPLYEVALKRMRYLVGKATGTEPDVVNWRGEFHFEDLEAGQGVFADGIGSESPYLADMRAEVERINDHPSAEYFIKKSIIVNNLFGVDIMEEAVEICKLRLFLTLIATVERDDNKANFGVEPLPDVDFNVLAGNTLVGYTSIEDLDRLWDFASISRGDSTASLLATIRNHDALKRDLAEYSNLIGKFRARQLDPTLNPSFTKEHILRAGDILRRPLDLDLFDLYAKVGLISGSTGTAHGADSRYPEWKRNHEPFHWLLEFPSIEASGGFDVVVGNPPFKEFPANDLAYEVLGFVTRPTGNLHAFCTERASAVTNSKGRCGLVLPLSAFATLNMKPLKNHVVENWGQTHISFFHRRPLQLFDGALISPAIAIMSKASHDRRFSSMIMRATAKTRTQLFTQLTFASTFVDDRDFFYPKLGNDIEVAIWEKIHHDPMMSKFLSRRVDLGKAMHYRTAGGGYWIPFLDQPFPVRTVSNKAASFIDGIDNRTAVALYNSSLFYWFYSVVFDAFNLKEYLLWRLPANLLSLDQQRGAKLAQLCDQLMANYAKHAEFIERGPSMSYTVYPRLAKQILDEIDFVVAEHYGLSADELDFILNYDLKYRMGTYGDVLGGEAD